MKIRRWSLLRLASFGLSLSSISKDSTKPPALGISCQGVVTTTDLLSRDFLIVCGTNYNTAYFRFQEMPISHALWHIQQWSELKRQLNPEKKPGFDDNTFEEVRRV